MDIDKVTIRFQLSVDDYERFLKCYKNYRLATGFSKGMNAFIEHFLLMDISFLECLTLDDLELIDYE